MGGVAMKKKANSMIGKIISEVFYQIGNNLNITGFFNPKIENKEKYIVNDREALLNDWITVGEEVKLALEKLEKTYRVNRKS